MDIKFQVKKLLSSNGDADDWLDLIYQLKHKHTDRDLLVQIYRTALSVLENKPSISYKKLMIGLANLVSAESLDKSRQIYLDVQALDRDCAVVQVYSAQFEYFHKETTKAKSIILAAKHNGCEPRYILRMAYQNWRANKASLLDGIDDPWDKSLHDQTGDTQGNTGPLLGNTGPLRILKNNLVTPDVKLSSIPPPTRTINKAKSGTNIKCTDASRCLGDTLLGEGGSKNISCFASHQTNGQSRPGISPFMSVKYSPLVKRTFDLERMIGGSLLSDLANTEQCDFVTPIKKLSKTRSFGSNKSSDTTGTPTSRNGSTGSNPDNNGLRRSCSSPSFHRNNTSIVLEEMSTLGSADKEKNKSIVNDKKNKDCAPDKENCDPNISSSQNANTGQIFKLMEEVCLDVSIGENNLSRTSDTEVEVFAQLENFALKTAISLPSVDGKQIKDSITASNAETAGGSNSVVTETTSDNLPASTDKTTGTKIEEKISESAAMLHLQAISIGQIQPTPQTSHKPTVYYTVKGIQYKEIKVLGKGGSCKVFEVQSPDGGIFALKKVRLHDLDELMLESYMNEIKWLEKMKGDKHIIRLYDWEVLENDFLFLVLEKGDCDLSNILKKTLTPEEMKSYWRQMLTAVETIHTSGIIHADLKPANFLLVGGMLKLIDFGIANFIQENKTSVTQGIQAGTLNYMSPESLNQDSSRISRASDVWSLGCILYSMIYKKTPYSHIRNQYSRIIALQNGATINYQGIRHTELLNCLEGCLKHEKKERFSIKQLLLHPYLS